MVNVHVVLMKYKDRFVQLTGKVEDHAYWWRKFLVFFDPLSDECRVEVNIDEMHTIWLVSNKFQKDVKGGEEDKWKDDKQCQIPWGFDLIGNSN